MNYSTEEIRANVFYLGEEAAIQDLVAQGLTRERAHAIVKEVKSRKEKRS